MEWKFIEIAFDWGPLHLWLHITLKDLWPHCKILEVSWDGLWMLSFGFHTFTDTALGSCVKWPLCPLSTWLYQIIKIFPKSALIAKTESNQSQGREATLLQVLYSCLMIRYLWEGWCQCFKSSLQCLSNTIWPFKIYCIQNNPSKCNPKLKMKTSLEVLDVICRQALFIKNWFHGNVIFVCEHWGMHKAWGFFFLAMLGYHD